MDATIRPWQFVFCALLGLTANAMAQTATDSADQPYRWRIEFSPHTTHYSYNPEHRPVHLLGLERESTADNGFYGLALFSNSFGQDSGYLYLGKSYYGVFDSYPKVYLKWSAGIL